MQRRDDKARGFGMLEVLVALVLVTSVGVAIVLWVESGLHSVARLRDEYDRMEVQRTARDWMRAQPVGDENKGEGLVDGHRIIWQRSYAAPTLPQTGYPSGYGAHDVTLYRYQMQVFPTQDSTMPWFEDQIMVVAAKYVRDFTPPFQIK